MDRFLARDYRQDCKYGEKCYQKNPEHKAKFKHPESEPDKENRNGREEQDQVDTVITECDGQDKANIANKRRLSSNSETEEAETKRKRVQQFSSSEESQEEEEEDTDKGEEKEDIFGPLEK